MLNTDKNSAQRDNDLFYEQALHELEEGGQHPATWARAISASEGSNNKAKSIYIQLRVASLEKGSTSINNAIEKNIQQPVIQTTISGFTTRLHKCMPAQASIGSLILFVFILCGIATWFMYDPKPKEPQSIWEKLEQEAFAKKKQPESIWDRLEQESFTKEKQSAQDFLGQLAELKKSKSPQTMPPKIQLDPANQNFKEIYDSGAAKTPITDGPIIMNINGNTVTCIRIGVILDCD